MFSTLKEAGAGCEFDEVGGSWEVFGDLVLPLHDQLFSLPPFPFTISLMLPIILFALGSIVMMMKHPWKMQVEGEVHLYRGVQLRGEGGGVCSG